MLLYCGPIDNFDVQPFLLVKYFFLHKNEFWTNIFDLPGLRYIFTRKPWLRAGLTIWFLLLKKTHLTISTQNVPKQKFSLDIVPKYKFTHTYQKCKLIADLKKVLKVNKFSYPFMIPSSRSWKVKSKKIWIIDPPPHSSRSRV